MYKVINKFKKDEYTYKLGYDVYDNKIYPRIEIWEDREFLSIGYWYARNDVNLFIFGAGSPSSNSNYFANGYVKTIKEMFIELRKYGEIPQYIEKEYEDIFLIYKLNDFNKI